MTRTFRMLNVMFFFVAMTAAAGAAQQSGTNAPATPQAPTQTPQQSQTIETYVVGTAKPPVVEGSRVIELTLEHTKNNKTRAAEILGISQKTLFNKLKEYGAQGAG